jgi:prepilin-type N-terminal cleavage/methylation domain-containing protein
MKRKQDKNGLTLVEILVAVAIVALLAAGMYSVSSHIEKQSQKKLAESTIVILSTALEQYHEFYGCFPFQADENYGQSQIESPTDPNGLNGNIVDKNGNNLNPPDYNDIYASSEALYYFLNRVPASKKTISSINRSLITNKDYKGKEYFIRFGTDTTNYPLIHIIDPWKYPLRYTYKEGDNFPVITSAGPDRDFNTPGDNISSK